MIIENILGNCNDFDVGQRQFDTVVLSREDMQKGHQRLLTKGGCELAVSLEHGCELNDGDVLFADANKVIAVEAAEEDVLTAYPKDNLEWGMLCFNIGNMHQCAFLRDDSVIIPYDYIVEDMIKKMRIDYRRETAKINGIRANFKSSHTHHSH